MSAAHRDLATAVRHHQAGDLQQAEAAYRRLLRRNPRHADALHLLGVIAHQKQDQDTAIDCIGKAILLNPTDAAYHSNLGAAHQAEGRLDRAGECYREALRLNPHYAEAHHNLGLVLKEQRRPDQALEHFRDAVRLKPDYPEAHNNLGLLLQERDRLDEALSHLTEALRLKPAYPDAHNNLGVVLQARGDLPQAQAHYEAALGIDPLYTEAHSNLGLLLQAQGQTAEARAHYLEALRLTPDFAKAHNNLGILLQEHGHFREASERFERAIVSDPEYADAHWNRALLWLLTGNFPRGWAEYEWRWQHYKTAPCRFPQPRWDGSPLEGRTILLHVEQGLGDTLQFVRYASLVKQRGGTVILGCQTPLGRLLEGCPGIDRVIPEGVALPRFDVQTPLLSLPGIFQTDLETIPAPIPYLRVPQGPHPTLDALLSGAGASLRVGIVWAGNPDHKNDRNRSCSLSLFRSLARIPGVALFSLQKGAAAADLPAEMAHPVVDLGPHLEDFAVTAAAIARLDLVVTVDTSVAHLAGALGKSVWLLLPFFPDWRWLLDREDSPWYPTMRLFRQTQPGAWPEVFERVAAALEEATASRDVARVTAQRSRPVPADTPDRTLVPPDHPSLPPSPTRDGMDAPDACTPSRSPEAFVTLPSALLDDHGQPRFVLRFPARLRSDPGAALLYEHETAFGGYEYPSRRFLDLHLQPGDLFIDVGAHWGIYTLTAATRWPRQITGLAIEPVPENAAILHHNLAHNTMAGSVEVVEAAAGAAAGAATLYRDSSMGHSLYPTGVAPTSPGARFTTSLVTLDDLIAARPHLQGRRTFIKIDAEGHEPEVLRGAGRLLASGRVAAIIWEKGALYDQDPHRSRMLVMIESLRGHGFTQFRFPHENLGGSLVPFVPNQERCNVFALAPGFPIASAYDKPSGPAAPAVPAAATPMTAGARAEFTKALAAVGGSDGGRWADPSNLSAAWDGRAARVADHIPRGAHVLDVGAGAMALRRYLDRTVRYTPADIVAREPGCLVVDLNQGQFPEGRYDYVTMLGVLEYVHDVPAALRRARQAAPRAIFTYSLFAGEDRDYRRALGWFNDYTAEELTAFLAEAGWQITSLESIENQQVILICRDGSAIGQYGISTVPSRKRVLVMGYHNAANFGDRLGYHLIPGILPPQCDVSFGTFQPWHVPEGSYDLVIVGIGNSLFAPLLTEELQHLVESAPQSIGIFGTQYRDSLPAERLHRLIGALTWWYARSEEDIFLYGRGHQNVHHLGDWLALLCPMGTPSLAKELVIRPDFIQSEAPLDRVIQDIQRYQRVRSARIHPLLVALHSASIVSYEEQREMGDGQVSGKFRSLLLDVFEKGYPEGEPFAINRHLVSAYQTRVRTNYGHLSAGIRTLLGDGTWTSGLLRAQIGAHSS